MDKHAQAWVVFLLEGFGFTILIIIYEHFLLDYLAYTYIIAGRVYTGTEKKLKDSREP